MFEVDALVEECRAALREAQPQLAVQDVLTRAVSRPGEMAAALGEPEQTRLVTLHASPELTVAHIVWAPGFGVGPHEHRMWSCLALYGGREDNAFWRRAEGGLLAAGGREVRDGEVLLLGDDVIHSVTNPGRGFAGALHVYGGDLFGVPRREWDPHSGEERPVDLDGLRERFAAPDL